MKRYFDFFEHICRKNRFCRNKAPLKTITYAIDSKKCRKFFLENKLYKYHETSRN